MNDSDKKNETNKKQKQPLAPNLKDRVDERGYESFPASDPPAHGSTYRKRMEQLKADEERENDDSED